MARLEIPKATISRWVTGGYLHPVLPTVYGVGHRARSVEAGLSEALLYGGPGAMLSHDTAAWWTGLTDRTPRLIHISTPRRRLSQVGVRVHGRRQLERMWVRGLPVTRVAQTLLDLAACGPLDRVRFAVAQAEYQGLLDLDALSEVIGQGRAGSNRLRAAVERHQPQYAATRSELENALLKVCERYQLPLPEVNVLVERWLVDAIWRDRRVVVELDGYRAHRTRAQLERDHERDLQLRRAGFVVLRYTWDQLTRHEAEVAEDLRAALSHWSP